MTGAVELSVVVAVRHASANLPAILAALQPETYAGVEFLFCHTPADLAAGAFIPSHANVRIVSAPGASLIPHLWRDGIRAARGRRVATTSAACIPAPDWVERLLRANLSGCAGIGGVIANDPAADAKDWAIYLLRYARFAHPRSTRDVLEIAADNALYPRAEILREADLLEKGFWEPSFHRRMRARGLKLHLDPTLRVSHRNRYSAREFLYQRIAHGREFARARITDLALTKRLLYAGASAVVPMLLLGRVLAVAWREPTTRQASLRALPWLTLFVMGWALGEARGYLDGLRPGRFVDGAGR